MRQQSDEEKRHEKIIHELGNLKYVDLQSEVIQRGMAFQDVIDSDHGNLSKYFIRAFDTPRQPALLKEFERWMDKQLEQRGYKADDPVRRFRKFSSEESEQKPAEKPKAIKAPKVPKPKREKDGKFNIYSGTKKQLTYHLTKDLFDKLGKKYKYDSKVLCKQFSDKLFSKVLAKFPEAQDKSVKIWMSRCMKQLCSEQKV